MDDISTIATMYQSSKGPIPIDGMAFPHLNAATAKMEREGKTSDPAYQVMIARRDRLNAEYEASQAAASGEAAPVADAVAGHNNPPEATTFETIKGELEDLRIEAGNFLDGQPIASQAEADALGLMLSKVLAAAGKADKARVAEKKPHDDAANEVQERYNTLIGKTKAVTGVAVRMETAIKSALTVWLKKVADEQEAARLEAERVARETQAQAELSIASTHDTPDIDERDAALRDVDVARQAAIDLGVANRAKAQVQGETRAIGLRSTFHPEITDRIEALKYYKENRLSEYIDGLEAMVLGFARDDIRAGKRSGIPGIEIVETKAV